MESAMCTDPALAGVWLQSVIRCVQIISIKTFRSLKIRFIVTFSKVWQKCGQFHDLPRSNLLRLKKYYSTGTLLDVRIEKWLLNIIKYFARLHTKLRMEKWAWRSACKDRVAPLDTFWKSLRGGKFLSPEVYKTSNIYFSVILFHTRDGGSVVLWNTLLCSKCFVPRELTAWEFVAYLFKVWYKSNLNYI
jgi:hypothetical protein